MPRQIERNLNKATAYASLTSQPKLIWGLSMNVVFERDSVCAGDDILVPNSDTLSFTGAPLLSEVLSQELVGQYLPCVSGTKTHWWVFIGDVHVAKIEHSCEPVRTARIELLECDNVISTERIFFKAEGQESLSR